MKVARIYLRVSTSALARIDPALLGRNGPAGRSVNIGGLATG